MNDEGNAQSQRDVNSSPNDASAFSHTSTPDFGSSLARDDMRKKKTLILSIPQRLEGLVALLLVIAALVFLFMSAHTLYLVPTPDSYRWYGDENWLLLEWKYLLLHGKLIVPIALHSTLLRPPGLLLGSPWLTAFIYGLPQVCMPPKFDPVSIGRTVSFIVAIATIIFIGWAGYRLKWSAPITVLAIAFLVTTRAFTFTSHSARYDVITGFAILTFVIFFTVRVGERFGYDRKYGVVFAFWYGLITVLLGLTVSPHVAALIALPAIFIAWYFVGFEDIRKILSLLAGIALGILLITITYIVFNHHLDIMGHAGGGSQASAYFQRLPVTRLFSWSAERHQLSAKLYYLWHEAPAFTFILPLIVASEVLLLLRRHRHPVTLFLTICFIGVLAGAAFFQSTLPYYLSHFLPLTAVTLAAHLHEWSSEGAPSGVWLRPLVAVISLVIIGEIFGFWLPELTNADRMGKRLTDANTAAVEAAIEFASRTWVRGTAHPLVLAQAPAIHELLRDTSLRTMSEAFLFFPLHQGEPVDSVLQVTHVNYIIDYDKPMTTEYDQLIHQEKPIFRRSGQLLDRTIDYFHDTASELDTLTMYEVVQTP